MKISSFLKQNVTEEFVPKGSINNKPAMVGIKAWWHTGDKPLSEAVMTKFTYCQTSNIIDTLLGNKIFDHSDLSIN